MQMPSWLGRLGTMRGRCGSDGDTPPHMFEREGVVMYVILRQTRPSALVSTRDTRIKVKLI